MAHYGTCSDPSELETRKLDLGMVMLRIKEIFEMFAHMSCILKSPLTAANIFHKVPRRMDFWPGRIVPPFYNIVGLLRV
jgi:hypothetical protein